MIQTINVCKNFDDSRKSFKSLLKLSWPGDSSVEKARKFDFTLEDGLMASENPSHLNDYPKVIKEAFQVMECTWLRELDNAQDDKPGFLDGYPGPYHNFNGITGKFGSMFILKIDKILLKEKYQKAIVNGVKSGDFPPAIVNYGYRDSKNFWYHKHRHAICMTMPDNQSTIESVYKTIKEIDSNIVFSEDACMKLVKVPGVFLKDEIEKCIEWAKENNVSELTAEHIERIKDKHSSEKF